MFLLTSMIYIRSPHVILHKMCGKIMLAFTSFSPFISSAFNESIEKIKFLRVYGRVGLWRVALKQTLMFPSEIACNFQRLPSTLFVRNDFVGCRKASNMNPFKFYLFWTCFFLPYFVNNLISHFLFDASGGNRSWSLLPLLSFKWV